MLRCRVRSNDSDRGRANRRVRDNPVAAALTGGEVANREGERGKEIEDACAGDIPFDVPDYMLDIEGQVNMYRTQLADGIEDPE